LSEQPKIVGGLFGLEPVAPGAQQKRPYFLREDDLLLVNARSALSLVLNHLHPRLVWWPAFMCPETIHTVKYQGEARYYERGSDRWMSLAHRGDVVVVLDEFGFPNQHAGRLDKMRSRGVIIVEDACQAMLSAHVGEEADYVIFSPRKFIGVADGGILRTVTGVPLDLPELPSPSARWLGMAREAAERRAKFDRGSEDEGWFNLFQRVELAQPCGAYAMSNLSRSILFSITDWSEIIRRRRDNYSLLLQRLKEYALHPQLPPGVVPLGFPVVVENRDEVRQKLFAEKIYPPVHWQLAGHVPAEFAVAHRLSKHVMTLPCDQRYDSAVIQRMAEIVRLKGRPCKAT